MKDSKSVEKDENPVKEVLPDVWRIEGFLSGDFFGSAPSSNVYILRDEDEVYIVDPGTYPVYKKKILELVDMFEKKGVKRVNMLVTQGHFDHATNCDVVKETGLPWKFYLPEEEIPTTKNAVEDFMRDIEDISKYEDVFTTMFPENGIGQLFQLIGKKSQNLSKNMLRLFVAETMGHENYMVDEATILKANQRITRKYGSVTLSGWKLGRFFISFDGAHSPGHICLYDPKYKLILSGDTTIEINPAFSYSSMNKMIDITNKYKTMAHEGNIVYTMDAHRSQNMNDIFKKMGVKVSDCELKKYAQSSSESEIFFDFFYTYYKEMKEEVLAAHRRIGRATVGEIVTELLKSENTYMQFKISLVFPLLPSRLDVLVVQVLKEAGAVPIEVDGKIVIDPIDYYEKN